MFASAVYVKIYRDRFWARHIQSGTSLEATPPRPVSTKRLLVGDFTTAEQCLKQLVLSVAKKGLIPIAPEILIQPMEMIEEGVSESEEKLFLELALRAGARDVKVYSGIELSDDEVIAKLKSK